MKYKLSFTFFYSPLESGAALIVSKHHEVSFMFYPSINILIIFTLYSSYSVKFNDNGDIIYIAALPF